MTPSEVKSYLTDRKIATLGDIALHFDMEPDAVRGILDIWIMKGRVRIHQSDDCQGGCCGSGCGDHGNKDIYEWLQ